MFPRDIKIKNGFLPDSPGVYFMKDVQGRILYIGKAGNLKRRVTSYFTRPVDYRIQKMVSQIGEIDYEQTDTALEALILEAKLIKEHQPPFNVKEKDDSSFLYVEITREKFPRVLLVRGAVLRRGYGGQGKNLARGTFFGPFIYGSSIREGLRIIRKIFPWSIHPMDKVGKFSRPCFEYEIGLCPGTCVNAISPVRNKPLQAAAAASSPKRISNGISRADYVKNIRNIKLFFEGKKKQIQKALEKEMKEAAKQLEFEKAEQFKRQLFALGHIRDITLISESVGDIEGLGFGKARYRIEGYDISNISGTFAVGSMVVFLNGKPNKDEYRKFKIQTLHESNDVGMMKEVLRRRFGNPWTLPDLILVDGGKGQVNVAREVLSEFGLRIPVVGIAKGPTRKKNEFVGMIPRGIEERTLIRVRDEAHRFAILYHRRLRDRIEGYPRRSSLNGTLKK